MTNLPLGKESLQRVAGDAEDAPTSLVELLWSAEVDDTLHVSELPSNGVGGHLKDSGDLLHSQILGYAAGFVLLFESHLTCHPN
jgi:hypothetical protein